MSLCGRLCSVLTVFGFVLLLSGCGGGSDSSPSGAGPQSPQLDGAVIWVNRSCDLCHGADDRN